MVATFNITEANTIITLQNLTGMTQIDWGDGNIDSELSHAYMTIGEYICKIYDATSIGYYAFERCDSLTSVVIGGSVTTIDGYAFVRCKNLTNITLSDNITSIDTSHPYYECPNLTYNIKEELKYLGSINNPYLYLAGTTSTTITNCTIDENCRFIHAYTFRDCGNLTNMVIPDSVTTIGAGIFSNCSNLIRVVIPDDITLINSYMFNDCSSLTSIKIPDSVTIIRDAAFFGCSSLTSVIIPDSVTEIGLHAFNGCNFTRVEIPGNTKVYKWAFKNCLRLTSVVIGNGIISFADEVFDECQNLTSVTCKNNVPLSKRMLMNSYLNQSSPTYFVPTQSIDEYQAEWIGFVDPNKILPLPEDNNLITLGGLRIYHEALKEKYLDIPTLSVTSSQLIGAGQDSYTQTPYIRFSPTSEQEASLMNENVATVKLDLTQLGNQAPAAYVWLKRNTEVSVAGIDAIQFTAGGEQFYYDNYATDIVIKNIGNAALVYVPSLHICDISFASISIPDLYYKLGQIQTAAKDSLVNNTKTWTDEDKAKACETIGAVPSKKITSGLQLYGTNISGDNTFLADIGIAGYSIARRGSGGVLAVGTPSGDNDAVPLEYFNQNKGTKFYKHTIDMATGLMIVIINNSSSKIEELFLIEPIINEAVSAKVGGKNIVDCHYNGNEITLWVFESGQIKTYTFNEEDQYQETVTLL